MSLQNAPSHDIMVLESDCLRELQHRAYTSGGDTIIGATAHTKWGDTLSLGRESSFFAFLQHPFAKTTHVAINTRVALKKANIAPDSFLRRKERVRLPYLERRGCLLNPGSSHALCTAETARMRTPFREL
jgi:hypothetical protein